MKRRGGRTREVRRLVAVLAADVAGYSRLMGRDEDGTLRRLDEARRVAGRLIARHRGRIANTAGDSLLVEFASAIDAVDFAVALQQRLAADNRARAAGDAMQFRIGIHVGDVMDRGGDIFGDGVNVAARLQAMAAPGGICVSGMVAEAVAGAGRHGFADAGSHTLHNIEHPVHVFRLGAAPTPAAAAERSRARHRPVVAVLPLTSFGGAAEVERLGDGVVEDTITALARFRWLDVLARNSTFAFRGRAVDVRRIARELGAHYVLEGSIRATVRRVRVTAQLIRGTDGVHVWAGNVDGEVDEPIALQERVAVDIVAAVEPRLREAEIEAALARADDALGAYDWFMRALAQRRQFTRDSYRQQIALFGRAAALDPEHAVALAHLGMCRSVMLEQGWDEGAALRAPGMEATRAAIAAGPDDPWALALAGHTVAALGRDAVGGRTLLDRALILNPNAAEAWGRSAMVRVCGTDLDGAVRDAQQALRLSPLGPATFLPNCALAYAHLFTGRFAEARDCAERAMAGPQQSRSATATRLLAVALAHLGRLDAARRAGATLLAIDPTHSIGNWRVRTPLTDPDQQRIIAAGLSLAGVPE